MPVFLAVMSAQDDRDVVVKCLHLGAADYLIKPLRHNELRNLWTRVWWRRVRAKKPQPVVHPLFDLYPLCHQAGLTQSVVLY